MRNKLLQHIASAAVFLSSMSGFGQTSQPHLVSVAPISLQTQTAPISPINAKYVNGTAPGYWVTPGTGLNVNITAGTTFCNGAVVNHTAGVLSLPANATSNIFLDTTNSCQPSVKTTAFGTKDIPVATVVTGGSGVSSVVDARTQFTTPSTTSLPTVPGILKGSGTSGTIMAATASDIGTLGTLPNSIAGSSSTAFGFADALAATASSQTVPVLLSQCLNGLPCSLRIGTSYNQYPYTDIVNGSGSVSLGSPTPLNTHIIDESHNGIRDIMSEPLATAHFVSSRSTLTPFRPAQVTLTRLNNVVTVTGLPDKRWCNAYPTIFNASDPSFNSPLSSGGYGGDWAGVGLNCNSNGSITTYITGPDTTAPVTATLTSYPQGGVNMQEENVLAGAGWYGKGTETQAGTHNDILTVYRKGLSHVTGRICDFWSLGDAQCFYDYMNYHQSNNGGNEDDENTYYGAHHMVETSTVPLFNVTGFVGGANNKLLLQQIRNEAMAGEGQYMLFVQDGSGASMGTTGKITAIDPTPPSTLDGSTKLVTVDATVPVSTAWGTFLTMDTPPNYEAGISMSTTLTQTGGSGSAQSGWFCLLARDRFERVLGNVTGTSVNFPNLRNYFRNGNVYQWFQGGMCTNPTYKGGNALKYAGATQGTALESTAQVFPIAGSIDAHTLVYVSNGAGALRSLTQDANTILPYTSGVYLQRKNNVVQLYYVSPSDEYYGSGNFRHPSLCNQNVTFSGGYAGGGADPGYNGTFKVTCDLIPGSYAFAQTGGNDGGTSSTLTLDFGKSSFTIFPYAEVVNTVDETHTCNNFGCYLELAQTDLMTAIGQVARVDIGGYTQMYDQFDVVTCYSSGCKGNVTTYTGPGIRGIDDLNAQGFFAYQWNNQNPTTAYYPYGGTFALPNFATIGGPWKRIFDLNSRYDGGSGAMYGGNFLHVPCVAHAGVAAFNNCLGANDIYSFLDFDNAHANNDGGYGQLLINQPNSSIDLAFDPYSGAVYSLGFKTWFMGNDGANNQQITTGVLKGNVSFDITPTFPTAATADSSLTGATTAFVHNVASSITATGNAGGDLTGTYPNPVVSTSNGKAICVSDGTNCPAAAASGVIRTTISVPALVEGQCGTYTTSMSGLTPSMTISASATSTPTSPLTTSTYYVTGTSGVSVAQVGLTVCSAIANANAVTFNIAAQ